MATVRMILPNVSVYPMTFVGSGKKVTITEITIKAIKYQGIEKLNAWFGVLRASSQTISSSAGESKATRAIL